MTTWGPYFHPYDHNDANQGNSSDGNNVNFRIIAPARATMEARWHFRDNMLHETADHRRIHDIGMASTTRNILHVLYDRECRGAAAVTTRRRGRRQQSRSHSPRSDAGDKSPATVVESPNSATQTTNLYDDSAEEAVQPEDIVVTEDAVANDISNSKSSFTLNPELHLQRDEYPTCISREVCTFAEYMSTTHYHSSFLHHLGGDDELNDQGQRPESSRAVSTISVAFSPDSRTLASTHGDHTVKISCCVTGRLLQTLEGHPRTPWTVKYHPTDSQIIASGCLGHQVRVWNWVNKACLQMVRLDYAIISVSFHPSGRLLAVANGTRLHFWGLEYPVRDDNNNDNTTAETDSPSDNASNNNRTPILTEMDQRHMLRCVHFPPDGKTLIIGGVNPTNEDPRRRHHRGGIGGGGMSFYLRLWDFDLSAALRPPVHWPGVGLPTIRRAVSNPRTFVPRALLYNDGGFDVSPDGKTLCACAEYWLPEGVDNATDLLVKEQGEPDTGTSHDHSNPTLAADVAAAQARTIAETHSAVSAAIMRLKGVTPDGGQISHGRSPSFREGMDTIGRLHTHLQQPAPAAQQRTPSETALTLDYVPRTPPIPREQRQQQLSPPSPPGRRFAGVRSGGGRETVNCGETYSGSDGNPNITPPPPPPPPPPNAPGGPAFRPPHALSVLSSSVDGLQAAIQRPGGRYVPHVVTVSLDTTPLPAELEHKWPRGKHPGAIAKGYQPRLGQLIEACPLDPSKASAVTCVKFSPSTDFCLIGYGVREPEGGGKFHPVTALYRIRGGMAHVSTMLSEIDDVNIARFHPDSGHGFVYGTKQGRVRVLSPRPWNFYNC